MRKLLLLFLFVVTSCASQSNKSQDITFSIANEFTKTDTIINLKITNNSAMHYVLPIVNDQRQERWKFTLSAGENKLFFIHPTLLDNNENMKSWTYEHCFDEHVEDPEFDDFLNQWARKKNDLTLNEFILLKPKQTINLSIPFHPTLKITSTCYVHVTNNINDSDYLQLIYCGEDKEYPVKILPELQKLCEKEGYAIYTKEIISNNAIIKN